MRHRSLVLLALAAVVVAGCIGPTGTATPTETPTRDASGIDVEEIPGVSDGRLTNATALTAANGATIVETGGRISITQPSGDDADAVLTVGSDGSYALSSTRSVSSGTVTVDYWGNESATYLRTQSNDQTRYRLVERSPDVLDSFNASLEAYLAAGSFSVANESSDPTTVVLTADEFDTIDDSLLSHASSLSGRLVLTQAGQVQNLTITGQVDDRSVTFRYELQQPIIERATQPAWLSEFPANADLRPELSVDVENGSYLLIENTGGDPVPRNATLAVEANNTDDTTTFASALAVGETRYAYFDADGSLHLSETPPDSARATSIDSPVSVSIATADGVELFSGGMAWESSSASADAGSDSSGGAGGT
jgi:hypothetical protein